MALSHTQRTFSIAKQDLATSRSTPQRTLRRIRNQQVVGSTPINGSNQNQSVAMRRAPFGSLFSTFDNNSDSNPRRDTILLSCATFQDSFRSEVTHVLGTGGRCRTSEKPFFPTGRSLNQAEVFVEPGQDGLDEVGLFR